MSTANQPPKIVCPHCQALIKAPALAAGSLVNCPKCGQGFRLGDRESRVGGRESREVESRRWKVQGQAHATQKPRAPDNLVDPNLLPPPPPREKPKPTEVAVVCQLCGTRSYAPLDKIGQTIKCPDCHSVNEVIGPKVSGATKKPSGP